MRHSWGALTLVAVCGLAFATLLFNVPAEAGGPLLVGAGSAGFGFDAIPFTWDMSGVASTLVSGGQIQYRTDGGNLGVRDNNTANTSVIAMFDVWENVGTSTVAFNRTGSLLSTGAFTDGDVGGEGSVSGDRAEMDAVEASCNPTHPQAQNPIIYDADGSLFTNLGLPSGVIGFAGACQITISSASPGRIVSAEAALNGKFRDGVQGNIELSDDQFDAVFIHEFGHFFGLDHSQINQNCLNSLGGCASFSDDTFGLPTMFPFLISTSSTPGVPLEESPGVHPARTLSTDDIAWVSRLYPDGSFASSFGTISGNIFYSTHNAPGLGFNVIARQVDNPGTPGINESRRIAVSSVSGYLGTACPGHPLGGNCSTPENPISSFGSRNPSLVGLYDAPGLPPGSYTVEVEGINPAFTSGSRVGPVGSVGFQWPLPGPPEFFNNGESNSDNPADSSPVVVSAGGTVSSINIVMNGTLPGQDALEPNTSTANAAPISNGTTANLSISPFGNEDFYTFTVNANTTATFEVFADRLIPSSPLDSVMEIVNASGTRQNLCRPLGSGGSFNQSCLNDDLNFPAIVDSGLEFRSAGGGTFFVHLVDFLGDGRPELQYSLTVSGVQLQNNPVPALTTLMPNSAVTGGAGFTLTVNGSSFINGSIVRWNGSDRSTSFISANQLQATIPAGDIAVAGSATVTVFNPAPGGGTSNGLTFNINNPTPVISALVPGTIPATSPQFTLTVNGSGFLNGSVVRWNCGNSSCNRTTMFVSSTKLQATIPATDVATVGTAQVRVFNPAPGGGLSNAATMTINTRNPLPTITGLSPAGVIVNSGAFTLTVLGANFVFDSDVRIGGTSRATTFIDGSQLLASILAGDITSLGTKSITVFNSQVGGGGGTSNTASLPIQAAPNAVPNASSLMPSSIVAGTVRDTLLVQVNGMGSSFINGSVVRWNGSNRVTMFNNANQLTATIPASDLVAAGTASVTVFTPGPGGGTSNAQTFTIDNPLPATSALSPSSTVAGDPGLTLTVVGSNFVPGSVVRWDGSARVTTFIGSSQLRAAIPASDLTGAGMHTVTVNTPGPGGGTSNGQTFTINSSVVISSTSTSASSEGAPAQRAATFSSEAAGANTASAQPRLAALSGAGGVAVTLVEPEALEPKTIPAGSAEFTLTVQGKEFFPGAVVRWNGKELPTKFVSPTELETVVPARLVAAAGSARVTVFYPESGVESRPKTFTISPR